MTLLILAIANGCDARAQDEGLMPACHQRVRLAVRLDEISRSSSKASAERAWRRHHAQEMGIELSGSDADVDPPEQEGPEPGACRIYCLSYLTETIFIVNESSQ